MAFAPNKQHVLATGNGDGTVRLWDLTDPAQPRARGQPFSGHRPLTGHRGEGTSVAFAPDGRTLATASDDGTAIRWDLTNPVQPQPHRQSAPRPSRLVPSLEVTRDGKIQATVNTDGTVRLWDLTDHARPRRLGQPLSGHTNLIAPVVFAPDASILATASDDGTVILWDLADRARPRRLGQPLVGSANLVISVAFAADGRTLVTGSSDGTVILWDLTRLNDLRNHATERACSLAGRGLDRTEWARYVRGLGYRNTCPVPVRPDDW